MPMRGAKWCIKENIDFKETSQDIWLYGVANYNLNPLNRTMVIQTFRKRPECNNTAVFLSITPNENKTKKTFSNILQKHFLTWGSSKSSFDK